MASSPEFVEHAIDLLSGVGPVAARRMFGGHGVFAQGLMFAVLDDDELFLKTDELTRPRFEAAGCRRWYYVMKGERVDTAYYRPPDEAHEDAEAMLPWARLGLECALRKVAAKAAGAKGPRPPAGPRPRPAPRAAARAGLPRKKGPGPKAKPGRRRATRTRSR